MIHFITPGDQHEASETYPLSLRPASFPYQTCSTPPLLASRIVPDLEERISGEGIDGVKPACGE